MALDDDVARLAHEAPRERHAAEERLRAAGGAGAAALSRALEAGTLPATTAAAARDLLGWMAHEAAVEAFRVAVPDLERPDLWAGAVAIAAEGHLELDGGAVDRRLAEIVSGARDAVPTKAPILERVASLTAYLREEVGLQGDETNPADVRNSYLPDVLERRRGLPVTLAVLWITVADRLGLAASGVGLPLHFVARCESEAGPLYVDAFHGAVLDERACQRLVADAAGREVALPPETFRPLRPAEVLLRMLRNLRAAHEREGRLAMALACVDRSLHLRPLDAQALRDRAILLTRLHRPAAAARALSRAMALEPPGPLRDGLEAARRALLRDAARRN